MPSGLGVPLLSVAPIPIHRRSWQFDVVSLLVALVPVAVGLAVLKLRLYDIDRLISRTLAYGLLTAILGLVYAGAVLVLGEVFGGIGGQPPGWALAGATLAVAALFQPARRRIQLAVDRRFNRRKYEAARTIEAFSARLREQVDLDTLSAELLAVVDQTVQPAGVSLWLRQSARPLASSQGKDAEPPDRHERLHAIKHTMLQNLLVTFVDADHAPD